VPHPSAPARAPVARSWKSGGFVHAFGACTGKDEETAAGLKAPFENSGQAGATFNSASRFGVYSARSFGRKL
jgi:hypothetical protein